MKPAIFQESSTSAAGSPAKSVVRDRILMTTSTLRSIIHSTLGAASDSVCAQLNED